MESLGLCCEKSNEQGRLGKIMKSDSLDDLKKIFILKSVIELKSLNKTAQRHKVTVSAISQTLKSLEIKIGVPLLVRKKSNFEPTEKALALVRKSEPAFQIIGEIFNTDSKDQGLQIGSLDLGAYESLAMRVLPEFSLKIQKDFPEIKLNLQISRTGQLIKKVRTGELCMALVSETDLGTDLRSDHVATDELGIFYCKKTYGEIKFEDLKNYPLGSIAPGDDGVQTYFKKFTNQFSEFRPSIICDSFEILRNLTENGQAVALLPKRVAANSKTPLTELRSSQEKWNSGSHSINLVSLKTCDQAEIDYVVNILKVIYQNLG